MHVRVLLLLALTVGPVGCVETPARSPEQPHVPEVRPALPAHPVGSHSPAAEPDRHESEPVPDDGGRMVSLAVPDRLPSVLWLPRGAIGGIRKPLVVSAHGAGGTPEAHCERWRELVADRAFVLCLRGRKAYAGEPLGRSRHYYPTHHWLAEALTVTLDALDAAYGQRVDSRRALFSGYSQGAVMGALAVMTLPERFPRLLMIEAQQSDWSVSGAQRWFRGGGRRVALACGLPTCDRASRSARVALQRGGVEVQTRFATGAGHTYRASVADDVAELLAWLVLDDPRWVEPAAEEAD